MNDYRTKIFFVPSTRKNAKPTEGRSKAVIVRCSDNRAIKSKTHATSKQAESWSHDYLADLRRGIERGSSDTVDAQLTLGQLIGEYNQDAGKHICTQQSRQVDWWKSRLGDKALVHLTAKDIRLELNTYMATPQQVYDRSIGGIRDSDKPRSPASRNRQLAALKAVFKWAMHLEDPLLSDNPASLIRNLPENNERQKFLTRPQVIQMLEFARQSQWDRCYLFLLGLVHTGARKNEWLGMEWQRINLEAGTAFVPTTKNGQPKVLALTPDIVAELRRIRAIEPTITGLVFPAIYNPAKPYCHRRAWTQVLKDMKLDHPIGHPDYVRLHDLRHSCAAILIENGATSAQAAEILGHKSLASTKRYSHLDIAGKQAVTNSAMSGLSLERK